MLKYNRFLYVKSLSEKYLVVRGFLRLLRSFRYRRYYIIADCSDNSITFSHGLYKHIVSNSNRQDMAKVFVFRVPDWQTFGFMVNPDLNQETQLADIQYNDKYKSIGFESLCPTVNMIFSEYRLPLDAKAKLTVSTRQTADGKMFYNIERPKI